MTALQALARVTGGHALTTTARLSSERWVSWCQCGWSSPEVSSLRTAQQAHGAHRRVGA